MTGRLRGIATKCGFEPHYPNKEVMMKYLMIDDERNLKDHGKYLRENRVDTDKPWVIVRSYKEFVRWIQENGVPDVITFDHDLADVPALRTNLPIEDWFDLDENKEYTGTDCARWVVNHCMLNGIPVPDYNVHSSNGEGGKNIKSIFETYKKYFTG